MNNCAKLIWNQCINIEVMARTCSIYDHFIIWPSSVTLVINLPEQMFQMALLLLRDIQLCQIILKFLHKCTSYGPDKFSFWPFYHMTLKCDLGLQPFWTNASNRTFTPQGQHLFPIILKSIHRCTRYGPDQLNLWPFWQSSVTLTFNLPDQMF